MRLNVELMLKMQVKTFNLLLVLLVYVINLLVLEHEWMGLYTKAFFNDILM